MQKTAHQAGVGNHNALVQLAGGAGYSVLVQDYLLPHSSLSWDRRTGVLGVKWGVGVGVNLIAVRYGWP